MIAVFAAVKGEDGVIRAEKFLVTDEEQDELFSDNSGQYARPWAWMVANSTSIEEEELHGDDYAQWWWGEWARRRQAKGQVQPKEVKMAKDVYAVRYTAIVHGTAYYTIPADEKLKHFVDGSAEIEWDFDDLRNIEVGDHELIDSIPEDDETEENPIVVTDDIPF